MEKKLTHFEIIWFRSFQKKLLLFPHLQKYTIQNPEIFSDSKTSDMIPIDVYTSYEISKIDDDVSDDDSFSNVDDDQSIMFDKEVFNSAKLYDNQYRLSRSKSDSQTLHYKPRSSKF